MAILYIGKGKILDNSNRVDKLIDAVYDRENKHGVSMLIRNKKILQLYPLSDMSLKITLMKVQKEKKKYY